MSHTTGPVSGMPITEPPNQGAPSWTAVALVAQAGVQFLTFVMGLGFPGPLWVVALIQAAAALGLVAWLAHRTSWAMVFAVPVVSSAATVGLLWASSTVAVGCNDRVLTAFEQLPPPAGASFEMFVGGETQDCMAQIHGPVRGAEVFTHYREEFQQHGWRITREEQGFLWAERVGMYINLYAAGGRTYFILEDL
jgi:hypothetical protein